MSADSGGTKRTGKADDGVLAALPSTRPAGIGRRAGRPKPNPAKTARAAADVKAAATKPKAKKAPAKKAPAKPKLEPVAAAPDAPPKPKAVRAGAPTLKPPTPEVAERRKEDAKQPGGVELVGTVMQAAGELAQIGLTVGGQIIKRAVDKLPKP